MNIFDLLFPKYCLSCKKKGKYVCNLCLSKVSKATTVCPSCRSFSVNGNTHKLCLDKTSLNGAIAIWRYEGVIKQAISRLKYNFNFDIAKELGYLASKEINSFDNFVLTPIPMHKDRQQWRGFNQAQILGKNIAKNLNLEYKDDVLIKIRPTTPQASLRRNQRLRSISGVFAVNNMPDNKNILLFDDIWTTGATLNEASKVLKQKGSNNVWGMTIAR